MYTQTLWPAALAALQLAVPASAATSVNPCRTVANAQLKASADLEMNKPGDISMATFDAKTAYNCVLDIPLDLDGAAQAIELMKYYFDMQSTNPYLKNPPKAYQQPAVDIDARFDNITSNIKGKKYKSLYDLDRDIYSIMYDTHEGHFQFSLFSIGIFRWVLPDSIVTVSSDGQALPQVYAFNDIHSNVKDASPIVELGGESVFTYLRDYVARTSNLGLTDPHAEWNQLMLSPAFQFSAFGSGPYVSWYYNYFQSTTVYNGESLKGKFANGTSFEWPYVATSGTNLTQAGWVSGNDIFESKIANPLVSGKSRRDTVLVDEIVHPDGVTGRGVSLTKRASTPSLTRVPFDSYPSDPAVLQDDFGYGGTVSGYILKDASVGVLSLPSFSSNGDAASGLSFNQAVAKFISQAKKANVKQVVIDLSGNGGGSVFQGYDTFKQFFPKIEPTIAFRTRATENVNTLGSFVTAVSMDDGSDFTEDFIVNIATQFANLAQLNAAFTLNTNDGDWKNWKDFYGPNDIYNDKYTNNGRYNLSSPFIRNDLGFWPTGYGDNVPTYDQPWDPKDIILLQDGFCGSTCTIFAELMKTDAGVKSVVSGGIPQFSPMQGVAGTRGSNVQYWTTYSNITSTINENMQSRSDNDPLLKAAGLKASDVTDLPLPLEQADWQLSGGAVNALDEIRLSSPNDPLQFTYEAANCRLFLTPDSVRDVTNLWKAAAKYAGGDKSVCVPGSTGGPGAGRNKTVTGDPGYNHEDTWKNANSTTVPKTSDSDDDDSNKDSAAATTFRAGITGLMGVVFAVAFML